MFFGALRKTFGSPFNDKTGKLVAVDFGKHGVYISKSAIGDPAFLTVNKIMFTIAAKLCGCFCTQCIAAAVWFGETVCPGPFAGDQFWDIFLFLFRSAEIQDR